MPQAVRRVVPPLLNDFIGLQKDTVLVSSIGVVEIFRTAQIKQPATFNFTPYVAVALVFIVVTIPLARLTDALDRARPAAAGRRRRAGDGRPARPAAASIEGLEKSFGSLAVLRGIDLDVAEHEVVCLIGASGSGKSTLLRCINLLEPIDAGRIVIEGEEITAHGVDVDRIRRRIGIVFQAFNLFPHMSVLDNITLAPRRVLKMPRADAEAAATVLLDAVRARRQARRLPGPAVRRPAAARRDHPGARDAARPPAARRGHERARPGARGRGPRA